MVVVEEGSDKSEEDLALDESFFSNLIFILCFEVLGLFFR